MLIRKLFRTAWSYKAQFISMVIMMTLGIGVFLGFNMEWKTIEYDTSRFFNDTKYADYRLYSETGFTKDELEKIASIEGVNDATRYLSVNLDIKGSSKKSMALDVSENFTVSTFTLISGKEYDENIDGIWLSDKFADANNILIGDTLTLEFQGTEIKSEVVGLIKSGEHMICVADNNQLMPDFSSYGYAYISPYKLKTVLSKKIINNIAEELEKAGIPSETAKKQAEMSLTDEMLSKATDKAFSQINLRSDIKKAELEDEVSKKLGRTLVGVIGCMILLVGGLEMRDTMAGFLDLLDNGVSHYTTKVNLVENTDLQMANSIITDLNADWESYSGISIDGYTATLDIVNNKKELFSVINEDNKPIKMKDDGVYLCLRLADKGKIGEYIEFSPYGSEETYRVKVIGYNRSIMTESVTMTDKLAEKLGIKYSVSTLYTKKASTEISSSDLISGKQDKQQLMDSFGSFVQIMDSMVIILVVAAVILGIVVLYNLGIMSYVERSRELATLKVLGFRSKKIGRLLISQNIWITVIGIIVGLPAGLATLKWLLLSLASEYELKLMLGVLTYSVSILLTFGVSLIVGWMVARKNKKIDMVEALKNAE